MPESEQKNTIEVHSAESGQKLLQYLMRRLSLPQPLLHRWIRTGQVRVNGGRAKPFMHVQTGDMIRLPPFALSMAHSATFDKSPATAQPQESPQRYKKTSSPPKLAQSLPPSVYSDDALTIYNKTSGLPVHGGTGHTDSLVARLEKAFANAPFKPTPAHRLDKDTSGLICVAFSYTALRALQEAFANHSMHKEYLAWVHGSWPHATVQHLSHTLAKKTQGNWEKVQSLSAEDSEGKEAHCIVHCIQRSQAYSLMHIRLLTGRTHQIRVQLAAQGYPIVGDEKYGHKLSQAEKAEKKTLLLHSLRITFPATLENTSLASMANKSFSTLPPWNKPFNINNIPPSLLLP